MMTSDGVERLRSFVAVPLPPEVQANVLQAARGLGAELPAVKWSSKVENLHITLRFLGDVPVEGLVALAAALVETSAAHQAFAVSVQGLGAFPDARRAATLWAGVTDGEGRLGRGAEDVERIVERLGLAGEKQKEARPFHPHVTVGRCKGGVDARPVLDGWRAHHFGTVAVTALHLYESRLGGGGSTYVLRGRAPLGAGRGEPATL